MSAGHQLLSDTARDALGYVGGGVLALSLVPQIIKLVMTKSAEDISLMWSLLYFMGTSLSFLYLVLIGALAAWIPVVVEMCGCIITITLKLMYDHTDWGRQQQMMLGMELEKQDEMEAQRLVLQTQSHETLQPAKQPVEQLKILVTEDSGQQQIQQPVSAEQQQQQLPDETEQQLQQEQQPQQQKRAVTKKRVVINVPLTTAEAEEAAAAERSAVEAGDVVLTVGVQLPAPITAKLGGPALSPSAHSSAAMSAASSPRSAGAPVTYPNNSFRRWHPGVSARRLPWYMTTGISHHSVLKAPQSPGSASAAACRCPTCGHRCLPTDVQRGALTASNSRRAWGNALYGSTSADSSVASAAATPHAQAVGSILSGLSRRLARSLSRFGSGRSSRKSVAVSQSATPEAMSPGRAIAGAAAVVSGPAPGWKSASSVAGLATSAAVESSFLPTCTEDNRSSAASNIASLRVPAGSSSRFARHDSRVSHTGTACSDP